MREELRTATGLGVAMALAALIAVPADATAQGIRYSLGAAANHIEWDDELGLDNGRLWGIRGGIDFGPVVGLRAHYLWGGDFDTRFDAISIIDDGPEIENQSIDVDAIGADLVFNVLSGSVVPYALAGGGILRFDPAAGERSDQIYGRIGAGVGFEVSRALRADVWVANTRMRLDRFNLAVPLEDGFPEDPEADELRSNWTFGVGLGLDLGGAAPTEVAQRWPALSVPVELFAGQLRHDRGNVGDQNLAGLRAGVDFRYVGVRAFYWRGLNDDWDGTSRVQGYGGEAQFNLQSGRGIVPFLVLGAGRLDYRDGFRDSAGDAPPDEEFLTGGGGLAIRVTDAFTINVAARDYIFSTVDREDVTSADELTHNWLFSAGLGFNIGRDRSQPATVAQAPPPDAAPTRDEREREDPERDTMPRRAAEDRVRVADDAGRVVEIPVPERGEIYIRYGEGARMQVTGDASRSGVTETGQRTEALTDRDLDRLAGAIARELWDSAGQVGAETRDKGQVDAERLRAIVRDELERLNLREHAAPQTLSREYRTEDGRLREVVRDELERLGIEAQLEEIKTMLRERAAADARVERQPTVVVAPEEETRPRVAEIEEQQPGVMGALSNPVAYMAVALSEPTHVALGGRVEVGRLRGVESLAVVPELALGRVNDGTSLLAAGNLEYSFADLVISDSFRVRPVIRPGVGLLSVPDAGTEGVLNLTYGFTSGTGSGSSGLRWFVEHQGLDLFDRSRLSAGLTWVR